MARTGNEDVSDFRRTSLPHPLVLFLPYVVNIAYVDVAVPNVASRKQVVAFTFPLWGHVVAVSNLRRDRGKIADIPTLGNDAHLRLLVPRLHFHTAPMLLRCSSTRLASAATLSVSFGSGVA